MGDEKEVEYALEELCNQLQDFYDLLKIQALMANGADEVNVTTKEVQGMLRCYLQYIESLLQALHAHLPKADDEKGEAA